MKICKTELIPCPYIEIGCGGTKSEKCIAWEKQLPHFLFKDEKGNEIKPRLAELKEIAKKRFDSGRQEVTTEEIFAQMYPELN